MTNDAIHDAVVNALDKDGWTIIKEIFKIECGEVEVYADLLTQLRRAHLLKSSNMHWVNIIST